MQRNFLEPAGPPEQAETLSELLRIGKDEMNLAEFPITLLSDRVPKGQKPSNSRTRSSTSGRAS